MGVLGPNRASGTQKWPRNFSKKFFFRKNFFAPKFIFINCRSRFHSFARSSIVVGWDLVIFTWFLQKFFHKFIFYPHLTDSGTQRGTGFWNIVVYPFWHRLIASKGVKSPSFPIHIQRGPRTHSLFSTKYWHISRNFGQKQFWKNALSLLVFFLEQYSEYK